MPYDYSDLNWTRGTMNAPGIRGKVFFIPKNNIATWPAYAETPSTAAQAVTLSGDFALVAQKTFFELDINMDKSPVTSEPQGEEDSRTFLNKASFKYPGTHEEAAAFAKMASNDDVVFILQTKYPNKYRVIGSEMWRTQVNVSLAIGAAPADAVGTTIEVECTDIVPVPFYTGAIVTGDGDQNPGGPSV
jgi:hypothetical protein